MTARKIAPTLVYAHRPVPPRELAQGRGLGIRSYSAADAWRELAGLLRVYQEAERMARLTRAAVDAGNQACATEIRLMLAVEKARRASGNEREMKFISRRASRGGR